MDKEHWEEIKNNEVLRKRLAKFMAQFCFRNSELENLHAKSKITDEEMKVLMIDVVNNTYLFLSVLFGTENSNKIIEGLKEKDPVPEWNDPEITEDKIIGANKAKDILEKYLKL